MSKGFFPSSVTKTKAPTSGLLPKCGACGLFRTCKSPKMPHSGEGRRKILIVGEAPGRNEDEQGVQFVGQAGGRLEGTLTKIGIDFRRDCWITNALICRPPNNKIPHPRVIDYCRPNLRRTVQELNPRVIILLGGSAVRSVVGDVWRENVGELTKWTGWNIPSHKLNAWVCPTFHPSYLEREKNKVLDLYFRKHLEAAIAHEERPWDTVPDWEKEIEVILDPNEAARILRRMIEKGGDVAFDFENNCLKPEYEGGEIICASACWQGKKTIAYPWVGEAITASIELMEADSIRLIASNLKHEDRWKRFVTGRRARHWAWDTMLAAHALDNREGITGLKFQSFVLLGIPSYDDHIKEFLRAAKGKRLNLAKSEIDLRQLLLYCGFDTLLEYKVAERQMGMFMQRAATIGGIYEE